MKLQSAVLLGIFFLAGAARAESNAPAPETFVRDFYGAYRAKETARLAQFYAPNATFSDPSFELDLKGPDQIRDLLTKALAKYDSLDFEITHTAAAGDDLTVEGIMVGKLGAKAVRVPFVSVFHFRDKKIATQRDLFDVTHFLVQLGVIPPPFAPKPSATPAAAASSPAASSELKETIARMDAKIFDAFNAHDVDALMALFTDDLEFYQDNDGLKSYPQTKEDFKKLFANVPGIKRELVKETLEVYPIKDYGAIEVGAHRFCHKEDGKDECGTFKFAMAWRKTGETWKISRVFSYAH